MKWRSLGFVISRSPVQSWRVAHFFTNLLLRDDL